MGFRYVTLHMEQLVVYCILPSAGSSQHHCQLFWHVHTQLAHTQLQSNHDSMHCLLQA